MRTRAILFAAFAALGVAIAPTIAEELISTPLPEVSPEATPDVILSASPSPTPSDLPDPSASPSPLSSEVDIRRPSISASPTLLITEPSETESATIAPPAPLDEQPRFTMRIPQSVGLDPRARTYLFPHIYAGTATSGQPIQACIYGNGANLDVLQKRSAESAENSQDLLIGDRSQFLIISGAQERVINVLNSYGGLVLNAPNRGLAGGSITFQFVALNQIALDPIFCQSARAGATTTLRALSLEQSTVKGGGSLK